MSSASGGLNLPAEMMGAGAGWASPADTLAAFAATDEAEDDQLIDFDFVFNHRRAERDRRMQLLPEGLHWLVADWPTYALPGSGAQAMTLVAWLSRECGLPVEALGFPSVVGARYRRRARARVKRKWCR